MEQAIIDPFQSINFTDSLKESVEQKVGLIYLIIKEFGEINRRCHMSIDDLIKEPEYEIKLTEIQVDPESKMICRIVYDEVEYK